MDLVLVWGVDGDPGVLQALRARDAVGDAVIISQGPLKKQRDVVRTVCAWSNAVTLESGAVVPPHILQSDPERRYGQRYSSV